MGFFDFFCSKQDKEIASRKDKIKALEFSIRDSKTNTFKVNPIRYDKPKKIDYDTMEYLLGATNIARLDAYTYGIDKIDVERIIKNNPSIANGEYIATEYDCDDFALALYGLFNQQTLGRFCFGLAISSNHAFNFFIDRNNQVWIVEPQSGNIYLKQDIEKSNAKDSYKILRYMV